MEFCQLENIIFCFAYCVSLCVCHSLHAYQPVCLVVYGSFIVVFNLGCHITEATMDHFMSLEADIDRLTKDDVVSQLKTAEERLESVTQSLADSDDRLKVLQAKTAQEFQDVVRLKGASLQG